MRFELTSLRLKGECSYPLCDEPKMVSAAGLEPASACLRGRYSQPLYDALMAYVVGVEPPVCLLKGDSYMPSSSYTYLVPAAELESATTGL